MIGQYAIMCKEGGLYDNYIIYVVCRDITGSATLMISEVIKTYNKYVEGVSADKVNDLSDDILSNIEYKPKGTNTYFYDFEENIYSLDISDLL